LCLTFALFEYFNIGNNPKETDFIKIKGHVARPIKIVHHKGLSLLIVLKEYPLFTFYIMDPDVETKLIIDSIYSGNGTEQGEEITMTIDKENLRLLNLKDVYKWKGLDLAAGGEAQFYSLSDNHNNYLKFDYNEYANDIDFGRRKAFYVFSVFSLLFFLYGGYKITRKTVHPELNSL
jgi:hypothetical protein